MNGSYVIGRRAGRGEEKEAAPQVRIDPEAGLSSADAALSEKLYGANTLTRKKKRGPVREFFTNLSDPIIRILLFAMGINLILTFGRVNWIEIGGIGATVFAAALVSTVSEYGSSAAFEKLSAGASAARFRVLRDGAPVSLPPEKIVKYDLIRLSAGDIAPCDGVVVSGSVQCDESALTGESGRVGKTRPARIPVSGFDSFSHSDSFFICRGTGVCTGECSLLATAVGDSTEYGRIAAELQDTEEPSPLKERLRRLAVSISRVGYAAAAVVAAAYLFNFFVIEAGFDRAEILSRLSDPRTVLTEALRALTVAVSIVVVAVPEGLPMMITVVLSANMKKMMKNGVLVKRLVGIETAGCVSVLMTDKTGTLTTGEMAVERVVTCDCVARSLGDLRKTPAVRKRIVAAASLCRGEGAGNATDRAISAFVGGARVPGVPEGRIPFDSSKKYAAALARDPGGSEVLIRGAPEYILPRCSSMTDSSGGTVTMDRETARSLAETARSAAAGSARVLAQASAPAGSFEEMKNGLPDRGLVFTCLFVIRDELRPSVKEAADDCRTAGIRVIMITGDGEETAAAVAREAGLLGRRYLAPSAAEIKLGIAPDDGTKLVVSSAVLHELSDEEVRGIFPRTAVISRVTPSDKSRLVRVAKEAGHVVGMTGDGVNDAPALKSADVGFAMGSGTEVAKEAGDVVIENDDFVSVTRAVLYGRTIFDSIRKFITFQLIMNLCAVGVSVLGPLFGVETPVTITQMLWINVIMDTLGSLAFAGEAPLRSMMRRPPVDRSEPILTRSMIIKILFCGLFTLTAVTAFLVSPRARRAFGGGDDVYFLTVFFALFVFAGIVNSFCARTERINLLSGLTKNKPFIVIMSAVASVQLAMIYFGGPVFRTVPVSRRDLAYAALFSLSVLPADLVCKIILRKRRKRNDKKTRAAP